MGFKTVNKELPTITIVLEGKIDATNYTDIENKILEEMKDEAIKTIVFDLNEVTYISSAGLRMFSGINQECLRLGKNLIKLINVNEELYKLFKMCGYTSSFEFEQDEK